MSSTKRGSDRDNHDRYYTQQPQADCCVELLQGAYFGKAADRLKGLRVLEAGVGGGAFARPLRAHGHHVTGIDIDFMASGFDDCDVAIVGSFIHLEDRLAHAFSSDRFGAVVGNPPFAYAEAFIARGLELAPIVAFLLRIAFVTGKGRYQRLWAPGNVSGLRYFYPLAERGSFTEDGKTDSADYAFFIIERGWRGDFTGRTVSWKP